MAPDIRRLVLHADHAAKRFSCHFEASRAHFLASIQGILSTEDRTAYAELMLKRLLFAYFLQHKGFLDGDPLYLPNRLQMIQNHRGKDLFYRSFLLPLFHEHLYKNASLPDDMASFIGQVPAFHLPLFSTHQLEHAYPYIQIADEAFTQLFTCFDAYRWRLDRRTRAADDVLRHDVLASLFEQRVNQKQMGAYYTKEDVTAYIARNTIIPCLFDLVRTGCPEPFEADSALWRLLPADPDRYIPAAIQSEQHLPTETEREYHERRTRYQSLRDMLQAGKISSIHDFVTCNLDILQFAQDVIENCEQPALLLAFYGCLERMSILDPTCGTGAFLFAALDLLEPLYAACLERIQTIRDAHPRSTAQFSHSHDPDRTHLDACHDLLTRAGQHRNIHHFIISTIITNNLHGVEVMEEATEICQLRLLLAQLAHIERVEDIKPLPSIERNIRSGNTLVGFIHPPALAQPPADDMHAALDECLATHYGINRYDFPDTYDYMKSFEQWRTSHQPFHWFVEFPAIMERGGFDVIIGNPPYVEYSQVRQAYKVQGYETMSCGNLYAAVIERSLALCRPGQSYIGLIVPLSICAGERFEQLRSAIISSTAHLWLSNFEIFPSRLFDGAFQRLSILLARHGATQPCSTHVTRIQRWYALERPHLIDLIAYTQAQHAVKPGVFPKLASPLQELILQKVLLKAGGESIARVLLSRPTEHSIYYQEATNYWMKATCRIPFYKKDGAVMVPMHGRFLFFRDAETARTIMALMNSSLFYVWFATFSDGFHLSHALVKEFPTGASLYACKKLPLLALQLEEDIKLHARMSTRNTRTGLQKGEHLIELEVYRMSYSKPLMDEIDSELAACYGLTHEELDFIINYDIKYRLGRDNDDQGA
jgi:hypothetical protein